MDGLNPSIWVGVCTDVHNLVRAQLGCQRKTISGGTNDNYSPCAKKLRMQQGTHAHRARSLNDNRIGECDTADTLISVEESMSANDA